MTHVLTPRFRFLWLSSVASLALLSGCTTPDPTLPATAGTSGTAGTTAGTSGTSGTSAGSSGTSAGSSGTAGTGGTAGTAGTGGTAGTTAGSSGTGGTAGTTAGTAGTTAGSGGTGGTVPAVPAHVRVAHLSPDAGPINLCAKAAGAAASTYANVTAAAFPSGGLVTGTVSAYMDVDSGSYDLAVVAGNAADCSAPVLEITAVTLADDESATFVASGNAMDTPSTLEVRKFEDNTTNAAAAQLRIIHAADGAGKIDVGTYVGLTASPPDFTSWTPAFNDVSYASGKAPAGGAIVMVDDNGYGSIPLPLPATVPFEIRDSATGKRVATAFGPQGGSGLPLGSVSTAFAALDNMGKLYVLLCQDDGAAVGGLTPCADMTLVPGAAPANPAMGIAPFGKVRLAHVSPDPTAAVVDICVKPTSYPTWEMGDSQALLKSVAYKTITGNQLMGIDGDGYDVKILVHATDTDCSADAASAALTATTGEVTETTNVTLAATGLIGDANFAFAIKTYANNDTGTAGQYQVRFIHTLPKVTAIADPIDLGTLLAGVLTNVYTTVDYDADAGYKSIVNLGPTTQFGINTNAAPTTAEISFAPLPASATFTPGQAYTLWAVGNGDVSAATPPQLLLCKDSETASAATLTCLTIDKQ